MSRPETVVRESRNERLGKLAGYASVGGGVVAMVFSAWGLFIVGAQRLSSA